jgi:NitT/TauT family transport system substrate-binding protein
MGSHNRAAWNLYAAALLAVLLVACSTTNPAVQAPTVASSASAGAATPTPKLVPIRLGNNRTFPSTALLIGMGQGFFSRAGVTIEDIQFTTGAPSILSAIQSGDLDAGLTTTGALFLAVSQGVKVHAVTVIQGSLNPANSYVVRADSGINSVKDLRGKKVAIPSPASSTELYLRYWLDKNSMTLDDLQKVTVPFAQVLPSVVNKQVDMGSIDSTQAMVAQQQYPGQIKVLFSQEDVTRDGTGSPNTNSSVLAFSDDFVQKNRPTVVAFLEAYLRAIRQVNADPKKAVQDWADVTGNAALRALPGPTVVPGDGKVYLTGLQFDADLLLKYGYLKSPMRATDLVDNSLVEEAAKRL